MKLGRSLRNERPSGNVFDAEESLYRDAKASVGEEKRLQAAALQNGPGEID